MKREEVRPGALVVVNGSGDLWMDAALRPVIGPPHRPPPYPTATVVRLTKGGKVHLRYEGTDYFVPPRNVEVARLIQ